MATVFQIDYFFFKSFQDSIQSLFSASCKWLPAFSYDRKENIEI